MGKHWQYPARKGQGGDLDREIARMEQEIQRAPGAAEPGICPDCRHKWTAHYFDKGMRRCNAAGCGCATSKERIATKGGSGTMTQGVSRAVIDPRDPTTDPSWPRPTVQSGTSKPESFGAKLGSWAKEHNPVGEYVYKPACTHRGTTAIVLADGRVLSGAQGAKLNEPGAAASFDLVIDCAGLVSGGKFIRKSTNPKYRGLNVYAFPDVIELHWPDMTAPTQIGYRFWHKLHGMLPQRTCVACMGSHGRTGTALACLLVADGMDAARAIDVVRKEHCQRAIETPAQEAYVKAIAAQRDSEKGGAS